MLRLNMHVKTAQDLSFSSTDWSWELMSSLIIVFLDYSTMRRNLNMHVKICQVLQLGGVNLLPLSRRVFVHTDRCLGYS